MQFLFLLVLLLLTVHLTNAMQYFCCFDAVPFLVLMMTYMECLGSDQWEMT